MLSPKEKAEQLVISFFQYFPDGSRIPKGEEYKSYNQFAAAKRCALLATEEIIKAIDWHEFETPNKEFDYWQEVKNEIEKL